jgi:hypothetical protein
VLPYLVARIWVDEWVALAIAALVATLARSWLHDNWPFEDLW